MFAQFLSADMTYSCGIFRDLDGDIRQLDGQMKGIKVNGDGKRVNGLSSGNLSETDGEGSTVVEVDELEEAQLTKLRCVEVLIFLVVLDRAVADS